MSDGSFRMVWALTATGTGGGVDVLDVPGVGSGFDDAILDDADFSEVWLWFQELAVNGTMRWSSGIVLTGHLARWLRCRHSAV